MTVFAIRQAGQGAAFYTVGTVKNQGAYSIRGVAPGTYHLYAGLGVEGNTRGRFLGGYTQDVLCGLAYGCTDHSPIDVVVSAGQSVTGIAVTDFYNDGPDLFPFIPAGAPLPPPPPAPSPSYPDAASAARFEAQRATGALTVLSGGFEQCPANQSCVALQQQHTGSAAAYFDAQAGSNAEVASCGVYVFQDAPGWHPLNTSCGAYPALGRSLATTVPNPGPAGCFEVRSAPGYAARTVECLTVGTTVAIDDGPVFLPQAGGSDATDLDRFWWHAAGHGWIVQRYVVGFGNFD
jgi:hypothetical protein